MLFVNIESCPFHYQCLYLMFCFVLHAFKKRNSQQYYINCVPILCIIPLCKYLPCVSCFVHALHAFHMYCLCASCFSYELFMAMNMLFMPNNLEICNSILFVLLCDKQDENSTQVTNVIITYRSCSSIIFFLF